MKRRQFLQLAAGATAAGFAPSLSFAQTRELRIGTPASSSSNITAGVHKFAEVLFKESKGRYKVNVYPDSQIGDIPQLLTGMQLGTIDMALLGFGNAASLKGGAALNVGYVPYLFKSKKGATEITNGPIFQEIYEQIAKESGVRVFALDGARSPRAIQTTKGPIVRPEDLKGLRIRVPPNEMFRAMFDKLGARTVTTGVADIYLALEKGQVDGQDNGFDMSLSMKWHEVAKFWTDTEHNYEASGWNISEKLWQSLSAEDRALFVKAARAGGAHITETGEEIDRNGVATLKSLGITYTKPDLGPWREALKDLHLAFEGKVWPAGLVDKIRALPENK